MEVIAFFGPPGTGKSDRALVVAYENKASCIIDDGILIYHSRIVAGKSAKREESRLKAVRRAIFWDAEQREEVRQALEKINPKRVLILGTSDRMVETICKALGLPKPSKYIRIQDVARPDEMLKAKEARNKEGKHVIPVPTMELKPYFKGYLIDPLRFFRNRKKEMPKRFSENEERSVVRPVFSYYGKLTFTDEALRSLILHGLKGIHGIKAVNKVKINKSSTTAGNGIVISLAVTVLYGENLKKLMRHVKDTIQQEIEYTTGMSVDVLKVTIRGVVKK